MVANLLGGILRAAMVVFVIAAPSFLLPDVTVGNQELSLIIAAVAAAFTIFEYASTHPGLIDFRFAPPYNRARYLSFGLTVLSLAFLCRAAQGLDSFSPDVLRLADRARALTDVAFSPVQVAVRSAAAGAEAELRLLVERVAAVAFVLGFGLLGLFGAMLWLLRWPVARRDFNLWLNLPTFPPGLADDTERRLFRDSLANIAAALVFVYAAPIVAAAAGIFDDGGARNLQVLLWTAAIWSFASGSLLIRGIAILKVAMLVRRTRLG